MNAVDTPTRHEMIFVNLPVADVARSRAFFTAIGYEFDEQMCNESALALLLGPQHYAMLLQHDFFDQFHKGTRAPSGTHEVLTCLSAASREDVDLVVNRAVEAGGAVVKEDDAGFMYGRTYSDPDGHLWEIMWMDVEAATEAGAFGS